VRNSIFTSEEANDLLAYYRDSAGVKEGIGHFLVREGYLEAPVADKLRAAIAKRADGHVVDSRKKVPTLNKKRGAGSATTGVSRRHSATSGARKVSVDPLQLTVIGVGMVVAIVAVVWLIWEMNTGSSADKTVKNSMESESARRDKRWKEEEERRRTEAAREAQSSAQMSKASYSASEIEEFENRAKEVRRTAQEASVDLGKGPRRGLEIIAEGLANLEAESVPAETLRILTDARKDILEMLDSRFKELQSKLQDARNSNDSDRAEELLDQIKNEWGDEFHAKVTKG